MAHGHSTSVPACAGCHLKGLRVLPQIDQRQTTQALARSRCDWGNPTHALIAAYGLPAPTLHGGFSAADAHEIQSALARLGAPTGDVHDIGQHVVNAIVDGDAARFEAAMTLARHRVVDLNWAVGAQGASMLFMFALQGRSDPAAEVSLADRIATMVRSGANPNEANDVDLLPLDAAWSRGDADGATLGNALLAAGADPFIQDRNGMNLLHRAAADGHLGIIGNWRATGLPETPLTGRGNGTPLMLAALANHPDVIRTLLEHPAVDLEALDEAGTTALQIAVAENNLDAVAALLEKGANILAGIGSDHTPYKLAVQFAIGDGDNRLMRMLQQHASDNRIPEQMLYL